MDWVKDALHEHLTSLFEFKGTFDNLLYVLKSMWNILLRVVTINITLYSISVFKQKLVSSILHGVSVYIHTYSSLFDCTISSLDNQTLTMNKLEPIML